MPVLFISDLHLCQERPATTRAFLSFLQGPAQGARALYILGDLFEYWAGDDDGDAPLNRLAGDALARLSGQGVRVSFLAGNRDFLLGEAFAARAGMQLLPDPAAIELDGLAVLLSHGDALCTDDVAYQAYRVQMRAPEWQKAFLARPLAERKAIIESLRRQSEAAKRDKALEIMDVNVAAVEGLLRDNGYPVLVHGHTHRPARHVHIVDDRPCERWVLSDWHDDAPYLKWSPAGGWEALRHQPSPGETANLNL